MAKDDINKTKVDIINHQIALLKKDILDIIERQETVSDWNDTLARKYKDLFNTSKTLFQYILTNYGTVSFNCGFFDSTIDLMLTKISSIQNNEITQESASEIIGNHLAKKYIPQLK